MTFDFSNEIEYNKETGLFYYKKDGRNKKKGQQCGTVVYRGANRSMPYIKITVNGECYLAHRLAWFMVNGYWPKQIDHIDGNGLNNKWSNLREGTHTQNMQNRKGSSKKLLPKGVFKNGKFGFMARIVVNKKKMYLGQFKTPEEAKKVYDEAAIKYFGEFAHI